MQRNRFEAYRGSIWFLPFLHNVFYAICFLKFYISHISVVVCSFFKFGTVSKWCIREWIKLIAFEANNFRCGINNGKVIDVIKIQEGNDGPVSLHWLIREIHSYQTLHYLGIGLKHKTPYKD